mmetsp:Transcript_37363/g.82202  ORF Transcript_37363/g.82202 Transcript_37363/m.82202 type:complete len:267 (+) Transcript_37363:838-1638(+)
MVGQDHRRLVLKVVRFDGAFKVLRPRRRVVIRMRNVLAEGEPAAADVVVLAKELEAPAAVAKVLDDGVELGGLLGGAVGWLLRQHHVGVHVGVDDVPVVVAAHRAFDAHQAVLGRGSDHRVRQVLSVAPALTVRFDPANVLAPAEAPLAKACAAPLERDPRAAPEEAERRRLDDRLDLECHDLLRRPHLGLIALEQPSRSELAPSVLLPRRVDEHHVELGPQRAQVKVAQVDALVGRGRRTLADPSVLELHQLLQFGVLFKPLGNV